MSEQEQPKEGWNWLENSTREHYFLENGKSMCRKWLNLGSTRTATPTTKPACADCQRRLDWRKKPRGKG